MKKLLPKQIRQEGKTSLAGKIALKVYYDGYVSISRYASDMMNFNDNKYIITHESLRGFYLIPNNHEGYKLNKRPGKKTWRISSTSLKKHLEQKFKVIIKPRQPLLLSVKTSTLKFENKPAFRLVLDRTNNLTSLLKK